MSDPTNAIGAGSTIRQIAGSTMAATTTPGVGNTSGKDFKDYLLDGLEKVNKLQEDADAGVQRVVTGQTDNVAEVLGAIRKADVAFSLLMEIRNKLMDAYNDVRQMRI